MIPSVIMNAIADMPEEEKNKIIHMCDVYLESNGERIEIDGLNCKIIFILGKKYLDREIHIRDKYFGRRCKEYHEWREAVYLRDNFTCQLCGQVGGQLEAHHIRPFATYPSLRYEISNGITLCKECHRRIHGRCK